MPINGSQEAKSSWKGNAGQVIEEGCYLIRYMPEEVFPDILFWEGTARLLRVGPDGNRSPEGDLAAGGDLYCRPRNSLDLSNTDSIEWKEEWKDKDPARWTK